MSVNKNPEWVTRGKIVGGLIKELKTFENKSLKMFISLDDSLSSYPIVAVLKLEDSCVLVGGFDSLESFIDVNFSGRNVVVLSEEECSIETLVSVLSGIEDLNVSVVISDGLIFKPISLVGKGGSGKYCLLKNCE